jgi:hypothetical protein
MQHVQYIQYGYLLMKHLECCVWRLALWYDIYMTLGGKMVLLYEHTDSILYVGNVCGVRGLGFYVGSFVGSENYMGR